MTTIEGLQEAIGGVAEAAGGAVVGVLSRAGTGSGVVIEQGRVLTNAHNVRTEEVTVVLPDGSTAKARPVGLDADGDLAVLDVDTGDAVPLRWNGDAAPSIGTPLFALANPGGQGLRVTFGYVSGTERSFRGPRGRTIRGSIEHTAPLLPGSSGGPIVDGEGRLVGLNTNRLGEGFYLALPADASFRSRVEALSRGEAPQRRRLGVAIVSSLVARRMRKAVGLAEADGALVRGVEDRGPADVAGLREGDLITKAGDRAIGDADDLADALATAGETIELVVLRGTDELSFTVKA